MFDSAGRRLRYPPVISQLKQVTSARFSDDERVVISDGLHQGQSLRSIAAALGRRPSTVSGEVRRNTPPTALRYLPHVAHKQAAARRRRPGRGMIAANDQLRSFLREHLDMQWSPRQICNQLRATFTADPEMHIVQETIYKALYARNGGVLGVNPPMDLRTGRPGRRSRPRAGTGRSRFSGPLIAERPADVAGRCVAGRKEGGPHLGEKERIGRSLPWSSGPAASLSWSIWEDDGSQGMSNPAWKFQVETGIPVYFCEPHSPWPRVQRKPQRAAAPVLS